MGVETTTQRLFDGAVLRLNFGESKVINLHMSGSIFASMTKLTGLNEQALLDQMQEALFEVLAPLGDGHL